MNQDRSGRSPHSEHAPAEFYRFGRALTRNAPTLIACWVIVAVVSGQLLPFLDASLTGPPLDVEGSESARAEAVLDEKFDLPSTEQDLIVFESTTLTIDDPAFRNVVENATNQVSRLPLVVTVVGPLEPRAYNQVSLDRQVAAAVVFLSGSNAERQRQVPGLTTVAGSTATEDVRVYVTGRSPLISELVAQEQRDLARAERLGLPAALLILLFASRTLVAAGLPILLAVLGGVVAFGVLGAMSAGMTFNLFVPNVTTMIGLGVGIDYSLVIVTRFREELAREKRPAAAVATAVATAGKTVFFSGITVIFSLAGLLLVNARIFRELAVGAIVAVAVMVLIALTLLPAALTLIGYRIERLRLPIPRRVTRGRVWERWAAIVMRHPRRWAIASILIILVLAAPATRLQLSLSTETAGLERRSALVGRDVLEREFNEGRISPLEVIYVSNDGPLDDADLDAIARLSELLANDYAAVEVTSVTTLLDQYLGDHSAASLAYVVMTFPEAAVAASDLINVASGGDVAVIRAVPRWSPDTPGPIQLVSRVRDRLAPSVTEGLNADVLVTGLSARIVDITTESLQKLPVVAGFIVLLSYVLLAWIFRSILIPIKAIVMNMLAIAAAYGLLVFVFQEGAGAAFFDFQPTGTTQVYLPLLTFAILFGLSMDYEVFLLGRIKEEWERTGDNQSAVRLGLQRSAGVISTAAAIMVVIFSAFTFANLMEVKQLGFSLAAAVFIDATLIRMILVPAAMQLLGHWNWWLPAWLDRILPRIDLSEGVTSDGRPSRTIPGDRALSHGDSDSAASPIRPQIREH